MIAEIESDPACVAEKRKNFLIKVGQQAKEIEILTAAVQKVSEQVELSKSAPQRLVAEQ